MSLTVTEQLAATLRALEGHMSRVHDGYPPSTASRAVEADRVAAREALARYDAGPTQTDVGWVLKHMTPQQVIEYLEDDVNMRVQLEMAMEERWP